MSKSKTPLQNAINQKAKARGFSKLWWFFEVLKHRVIESQEALVKRQHEINDDRTFSKIEREMNKKK